MMKNWIVAVILGLMASVKWAGPVGPEFLVNTYTTLDQRCPSVAMDASGNFVIVWWSDGQDGDANGVYAQLYDTSGNTQGGEFLVNSYTTDSQYSSSVAMDGTGNSVVVWTSIGQDGDAGGIFAQRYDALGNPQGSEFQVNTYTTDSQGSPSIGMNTTGNFVIVWMSDNQDGNDWGVYGQRYDALGNPQGGEFQINTYTNSFQADPAVAIDETGNFVVVWESNGQDGHSGGVFGQRFDALGNPQGNEFQVNTYWNGGQREPSVGMDTEGNYIISWHSVLQDGDSTGIYAKRYDAFGDAVGDEFLVNTTTEDGQMYPSVAMDGEGNTVIAWVSDEQDGDAYGIYAQRYDASGNLLGSEFQVNSYTTSYQNYPSVGTNSSKNFVIVWQSDGQDGDLNGVYAQRFDPVPIVNMITTTTSSITEGGTLGFDVTFSEPVTGVDLSDFVLFTTGDISGATILSVTGSGSEYTVLVADVDGDGTLRLDLLDDDSIIDGGGNPLGGVGVGNGDFTGGESYTVVPELSLTVWPLILLLLLIGIMVLFRKSRIILG